MAINSLTLQVLKVLSLHNELLRKALVISEGMEKYKDICTVHPLQGQGYRFIFEKDPDKILEIEIFPEMIDPDDPIMLTHKLRLREDDGESYLCNCFNRTVDEAIIEAREIITSWQ
jgi:hypothetical protein